MKKINQLIVMKTIYNGIRENETSEEIKKILTRHHLHYGQLLR
jgi:hypothetical protein